MTLKLPRVRDPEVQTALDIIAQQFPVQAQGLASPASEAIAGTGLKVIRGIISTVGGTGSITEGTGFTINRTGAGLVTVTFTAPFSDVPAVTLAGSGTGVVGAKINEGIAISASGVSVAMLNKEGAAGDGIFHFQAIGPR